MAELRLTDRLRSTMIQGRIYMDLLLSVSRDGLGI